jgi:hypothetical protein
LAASFAECAALIAGTAAAFPPYAAVIAAGLGVFAQDQPAYRVEPEPTQWQPDPPRQRGQNKESESGPPPATRRQRCHRNGEQHSHAQRGSRAPADAHQKPSMC